MKALVTGSNGFLGTALVERLLARGEEDVRCFVRSDKKLGKLDAVLARYPGARAERFKGSLSTVAGAAAAIEGVDVIYHLAAALSGPAAELTLNTVVASKNLLEAVVASKRTIKIVLVSSFGVYGVADLPPGSVINEETPLELHPERRDLYSQTKRRQERLFWEYHEKYGFPLTVLRPGVIYGPGGSAFSSRVGLQLFGVFFHLGGDNLLPLTYVDNCAEAIALAGINDAANGHVYNVVDDDLITASEYLKRYQQRVGPLRVLPVPYPLLLAGSMLIERYHAWSKGQLPAIFTPYKTRTSWRPTRFDNSRIKTLGHHQIVPTDEGLERTFAWLAESR